METRMQKVVFGQYESFAHRWFEEVWNQGRVEAIDEMLAEDGIAHGLSDANGNEPRGPAGLEPLFRKFRDAFPDIHITVDQTVSQGDLLAVRCSVNATYEGDPFDVGPTNQPVCFTGMCIFKIRDEKIVEAWNCFDFLTMYKQLGASVSFYD
jgi:predicted ester cyclase